MSPSPSRREFLKVAGTTLLAAGSAPRFLNAQDKAGSKLPVIGSGNWKYECHHNWGEVPEHIHWKNTHGAAIDQDGLVYITHQGDAAKPCDTVVVFEPNGKFVRSFGKEYAGGGHGIDIRNEDGTEYIYLSVTAPHRVVVKTDKQGNVVWKQSAPEMAKIYDKTHQFSPTNVCFGPNSELFIGDGYGSHYLHQYDKDGNYVRSWGGPGEKAGQLRTPHGQWLDLRDPNQPLIAVADRANARLQFFTLDGKPTAIIQGLTQDNKDQAGSQLTVETPTGETVPGTSVYGIAFPASVDSLGEYLLIADLHARVVILDRKNNIAANLGFNEDWTTKVLDGKPFRMRTQPNSWEAGRFVHPHDATFDKAGNIYVAEWVDKGRLTFLRRLA